MIYLAVSALATVIIGMIHHAKTHPNGVNPNVWEGGRPMELGPNARRIW